MGYNRLTIDREREENTDGNEVNKMGKIQVMIADNKYKYDTADK